MTNANKRAAQKVTDEVIERLFTARYGLDYGETLTKLYLVTGRPAVAEYVDGQGDCFPTLAKRLLRRLGAAGSEWFGGLSDRTVGRLQHEESECQRQLVNLVATTPLLDLDNKEDTIVSTNDACILVTDIDLYIIGRILARERVAFAKGVPGRAR